MTSIDIYDDLVKNLDRSLLASERQSRKSVADAAADEFQILTRQIKDLLEEVSNNNRDIIRLKDKLLTNAKSSRENQLCQQIKKLCDQNYALLSQMRENLVKASKILEKLQIDAPSQPQTLSKVYRKKYLTQQVDKMLNESFTVQKLVEKFSIETTLARIRLLLPQTTQQQARKMIEQKQGFQKAVAMKVTGKASLKLKYARQDYLDKAKGISQLEASVQENLKLMKEVARLVHEQGKAVDDIFQNVSQAKGYITKAEVILQKQKQQHKKSRKRMCCIIFIGLLLIGIALTPLIIKIVKSKTSTDTPATNSTLLISPNGE